MRLRLVQQEQLVNSSSAMISMAGQSVSPTNSLKLQAKEEQDYIRGDVNIRGVAQSYQDGLRRRANQACHWRMRRRVQKGIL